MTCGEARELLFAFLDSELDAALSVEVQRHLEHCPACAREAEVERAIRTRLGHVLVPEASDTFDAEHVLFRIVTPQHPSTRRGRRAAWQVGIAAGLLLVPLAWFAWWQREPPGRSEPFAELLAHDFEHFLNEGKPLQHASNDPESVGAWLAAQTELRVELPTMHGQHCRLIGGRKCTLAQRSAALALYEMAGEPASLLAFAGTEADLAGMEVVGAHGYRRWVDRRRGLTVVAAPRDGVVYAAVGRLPESELVSLLR